MPKRNKLAALKLQNMFILHIWKQNNYLFFVGYSLYLTKPYDEVEQVFGAHSAQLLHLSVAFSNLWGIWWVRKLEFRLHLLWYPATNVLFKPMSSIRPAFLCLSVWRLTNSFRFLKMSGSALNILGPLILKKFSNLITASLLASIVRIFFRDACF